MRKSFLMAVILVAAVVGSPAAPHLEGCLSQSAIASATAKLAKKNWRGVSLPKLRQIWPSEISGLNCEADVCHSVWSMDRIIAGHCQCCATFAFKIQQSTNGVKVEQLDEVILNYSALERPELIDATKKIVTAMGLSGADLATLGSVDEQNFHWTNTNDGENELSTVEVRFARRGQMWELLLNWGRNPIEPSPRMSD